MTDEKESSFYEEIMEALKEFLEGFKGDKKEKG